jgi:hypothetical protein
MYLNNGFVQMDLPLQFHARFAFTPHPQLVSTYLDQSDNQDVYPRRGVDEWRNYRRGAPKGSREASHRLDTFKAT